MRAHVTNDRLAQYQARTTQMAMKQVADKLIDEFFLNSLAHGKEDYGSGNDLLADVARGSLAQLAK